MAISNEKVFFTKILAVPRGTTFTATDTTAKKSITTFGTDGSIINGIIITTNETAENDIMLFLSPDAGITFYPLGHIDIKIGAGTSGTADAANGLNETNLAWVQRDADGNPFIKIKDGVSLYGSMKVTIAGSFVVSVTVLSEDY